MQPTICCETTVCQVLGREKGRNVGVRFAILPIFRTFAPGFAADNGLWNRHQHSTLMHIGHRIQEVVRERRLTSVWLARELGCDRTNIYRIYDKRSVDTGMLVRISRILQHNFFEELAAEVDAQM